MLLSSHIAGNDAAQPPSASRSCPLQVRGLQRLNLTIQLDSQLDIPRNWPCRFSTSPETFCAAPFAGPGNRNQAIIHSIFLKPITRSFCGISARSVGNCLLRSLDVLIPQMLVVEDQKPPWAACLGLRESWYTQRAHLPGAGYAANVIVYAHRVSPGSTCTL